MRCNDSFVHAVFQAQFRSSLTCPRCQRQSNTFDPFLCVSVPVPQDQYKAVIVNVLYTNQQPRQVRLGLSVPLHADVRDLRELLASDTGIPEPHMLVTEIDDAGFHRTFSDKQPVSIIRHTDPVYCLELPQLKEASCESGQYVLLCWINVLTPAEPGGQCTRFGSPFTMQVCRETSYQDLQKLLLKEMAATLHDDVLTAQQEVPLFRMRVCDAGGEAGTTDHSYLDPQVDHPLYTQPVDQALAMCEAQPHVKLVLEWDAAAKERIIADDSDQLEELASVRQMLANAEQGHSVTLEQCFELYTKAEVLGAENAWHCPNCNLKQEVEKKLGLWTLPDILVIHLKRFRQAGGKPNRSSVKLTTLVDFPPYGLDMSPHVCPAGGRGGGWSPWQRPPAPTPPPPPTYDLYAVCNHHGQDLQSGHYTAYCRNPYDGRWYCFDDAAVSPVSEAELVSPAAYILFYQRRGLVSPSSNSSCSSTVGPDHWAARLVHIPEENNSESIKRNGPAYATLPPSARHADAPPADINSPSCERRDAEREEEEEIRDIDADDTELSESRV